MDPEDQIAYLNLNHKVVKIPIKGGYYDLDSGKRTRDTEGKLVMVNPRVVSKYAGALATFCSINNLTLRFGDPEWSRFLTKDHWTAVRKGRSKLKKAIKTYPAKPYLPEISNQEIKGLKSFSLDNLKCNGQVIEVLSGNLLNLALQFTLAEFSKHFFTRDNDGAKEVTNAIVFGDQKAGFIINVPVRLFGVAVPEKSDVKRWEHSKDTLSKILGKYGGYCHVNLLGQGKDGYYKAELYADPKKTINITELMLNDKDDQLGYAASPQFIENEENVRYHTVTRKQLFGLIEFKRKKKAKYDLGDDTRLQDKNVETLAFDSSEVKALRQEKWQKRKAMIGLGPKEPKVAIEIGGEEEQEVEEEPQETSTETSTESSDDPESKKSKFKLRRPRRKKTQPQK